MEYRAIEAVGASGRLKGTPHIYIISGKLAKAVPRHEARRIDRPALKIRIGISGTKMPTTTLSAPSRSRDVYDFKLLSVERRAYISG